MARSATQVMMDQVDAAWKHPWESILTALEDVTDEEALWQPPGYEAETNRGSWPKTGTILWQIAHIATAKRGYLEFVSNRTSDHIPYSSPTPERSLDVEKEYLRATHSELRETLSGLTEKDISQDVSWCEEKLTLYQFVNMTIRHDVWHAGQISIVSRLWRGLN